MFLYLGKETHNAFSHLMDQKLKSPLSTNMLALWSLLKQGTDHLAEKCRNAVYALKSYSKNANPNPNPNPSALSGY